MNKIISLFDYIFYRIYKFSEEKGDNVPDTKGSLILSLIQCFTILDIMIVVNLIHDYTFPSKWIFFLPLFVVVGAINWYRYERSFDIEKLENQWKDEDPEKRARNSWLIGIYILISFLFPVVLGILEHNLNLI